MRSWIYTNRLEQSLKQAPYDFSGEKKLINTDIHVLWKQQETTSQSKITGRIEFIIVNFKMLFTTLQYPNKVNHQAGWVCQRPLTHPYVLNKTLTFYKPSHLFPSEELIFLR